MDPFGIPWKTDIINHEKSSVTASLLTIKGVTFVPILCGPHTCVNGWEEGEHLDRLMDMSSLPKPSDNTYHQESCSLGMILMLAIEVESVQTIEGKCTLPKMMQQFLTRNCNQDNCLPLKPLPLQLCSERRG